MTYEPPELGHMTAKELSGLMLACAFSRDKSDQMFAIACREELKRRKPAHEKALQTERDSVDSGLRARSHGEPKEQSMENEVDKAVAAVDGGVGAETPVPAAKKPKAKPAKKSVASNSKSLAPGKKAAKKPVRGPAKKSGKKAPVAKKTPAVKAK